MRRVRPNDKRAAGDRRRRRRRRWSCTLHGGRPPGRSRKSPRPPGALPMRPLPLLLLPLLLPPLLLASPSAGARAQQPPSPGAAPTSSALRITGVTPSGTAGVDAPVTISFDRAMAAAPGESAEGARAFLQLWPQTPGRLEWEDEWTLRLTPDRPLRRATRYSVAVLPGLQSRDGARLPARHEWTFETWGPRLLGSVPTRTHVGAPFLVPGIDARMRLLWSDSIDVAELSARSFFELAASCPGGPRAVAVAGMTQRPMTAADRAHFGSPYVEGFAADTGLRRVVELRPAAPIPEGCEGKLVLPQLMETAYGGARTELPFRTPGPVELVSAYCGLHWMRRQPADAACPQGPIAVAFSSPVRGSEVARHVRLSPAVPVVVDDTLREADAWNITAGPLAPATTYTVTVDPALRDAYGVRARGPQSATVGTTHVPAAVGFETGLRTLAGGGRGLLPVRYVNLDSLVVTLWTVPDSLAAGALRAVSAPASYTPEHARTPTALEWLGLSSRTVRLAVRAPTDSVAVAALDVAALAGARRLRPGALVAVAVAGVGRRGVALPSGRDWDSHLRSAGLGSLRPLVAEARPGDAPVALVQTTPLAVHAKVGAGGGFARV